MIQAIIGQGIVEQAGAVGDRAAGHIAPGVVATAIDLPRLGGAGRAGAIEAGQLVRLTAATVEVLLLGAAPVEWPLPQLAQVRVDVRITVAGPRQAVARSTATGAVACCRGCPRVARPHEAILLIVAERFGLAAPRIGGVRHGCLRGGQTGHVARRVVGTRLAEDGTPAGVAAVGPPGGRRAGGAQVGIVAELLGCQRPACGGLEVDGVQLCARVIDQRRQIGRGAGVVAQPGECSCAVIDVREGVALARRRGSRRGGDELIGVVIGEGLLEGRERWEGEVATGRRELQALGDHAPALVVLHVLGDLALRVVRVRKVVNGEALGQPPFGVIGAAPTHACWISIIGVLHKGVIVATVGAGATRAGVAELRRLILRAAQPVQQVIGVANGTRAGAILDEIPIGVIGVIVRAMVGVADAREPPQVVVAGGGRHAGDRLPTLGRFVGHLYRGGLVQGVVLEAFQCVSGERPTVGAALLLRVDRAAQVMVLGMASSSV